MAAARHVMVAALVPRCASVARNAATMAGVAGSGSAPRVVHQAVNKAPIAAVGPAGGCCGRVPDELAGGGHVGLKQRGQRLELGRPGVIGQEQSQLVHLREAAFGGREGRLSKARIYANARKC